MNLLITICARGGSKGIPGKNIRILNGKPLIVYSIETAKAFAAQNNADIALSTDSEEIKQIALQNGLATHYSRPEHLAMDTAGKKDTISDLVFYEEKNREKKYDYVLDLDITSPLRSLQDLTLAFGMLQKDPDAVNIFSVNPANRNPYFNMVEKKENGYYGLVKKGSFLTRQSAPGVYDLNASFYFYRRSYFDQEEIAVINDHSLVFIMDHICFDLDHPLDFDFMEYLIANKKTGLDL